MLSRIAAAWRKTIPMVRIGGQWKGPIEGLVNVGGVWKRFYPPSPNYSGIVRMDKASNTYWQEYYAYVGSGPNGDPSMGYVTTRHTVNGVRISSIALTVQQANNGPISHRTLEIALDGDRTADSIPYAWVNGVRADLTSSTISGSVTIFFFTSTVDMAIADSYLVEF